MTNHTNLLYHIETMLVNQLYFPLPIGAVYGKESIPAWNSQHRLEKMFHCLGLVVIGPSDLICVFLLGGGEQNLFLLHFCHNFSIKQEARALLPNN